MFPQNNTLKTYDFHVRHNKDSTTLHTKATEDTQNLCKYFTRTDRQRTSKGITFPHSVVKQNKNPRTETTEYVCELNHFLLLFPFMAKQFATRFSFKQCLLNVLILSFSLFAVLPSRRVFRILLLIRYLNTDEKMFQCNGTAFQLVFLCNS